MGVLGGGRLRRCRGAGVAVAAGRWAAGRGGGGAGRWRAAARPATVRACSGWARLALGRELGLGSHAIGRRSRRGAPRGRAALRDSAPASAGERIARPSGKPRSATRSLPRPLRGKWPMRSRAGSDELRAWSRASIPPVCGSPPPALWPCWRSASWRRPRRPRGAAPSSRNSSVPRDPPLPRTRADTSGLPGRDRRPGPGARFGPQRARTGSRSASRPTGRARATASGSRCKRGGREIRGAQHLAQLLDAEHGHAAGVRLDACANARTAATAQPTRRSRCPGPGSFASR